MGLDIHVMRPRRLFMRDYEPPVQKLMPGVEVEVICAKPLSATDAGMVEHAILEYVRRHQRNKRYFMPNSDEIHFSERFSYTNFDLLREFAAFLDYPQKTLLIGPEKAFGDGYDLDALPSLKGAWRTKKSSYPHLVFHEDNQGFYFPTTFDFPVKTDFGYFGSTMSLREELVKLSTITHRALRHKETIDGAIQLLLKAAEASEQSGLPIVFDG